MMKHLFTVFFLLLALTAAAQDKKPQQWPSFLTLDQIADGVAYLPAPPDTSSVDYLCDFSRYQWGKSLRHTLRGEQAAADADLSVPSLLSLFSAAMGITMTREQTPELYALVERLDTDGGNAIRKAKNHYKRRRPFVQFHEPTLLPHLDEGYRTTYSYPSGHSSVGWCIALVLAEINPARQEAILKRGYEMGESRVIAGFHYQSDVDAARLAASAVVARLHADSGFQRHLVRAKKEFAKVAARQQRQ